jgi:LCP family protein required for cell wall assembly
MQSTQEARPGARSPFVAAFLSLLFPGLGHAYAGAYQRALAFAAAPVLIIALALGVAVRSDRGELLGWMIDNLGSIFVVNILVFAYRAVALVDAWRVAAFLNAVRDSGGGRLGGPRVPVSVLSIAGLAAVILTMSVAHVAVARYDLAAQDLANCVFDSSGTATDCSDQGDNTASGSNPPGASDQGAESDEPQVTPQGTANQPVQSQASLPPWNGTDRLNILLLGVDQRPHEATFNTDTMIVVSIDPASGQVAMLSLPRDSVDVPVPPGPAQQVWGQTYGGKINSWFQANRNRADLWPGNNNTRGYNALKAILGNLYGIDIRYYVQVNFEGFIKVIDTLGGVTINVQKPVVDDFYPGDSGQLLRVYIPTGVQHMNGTQALIYARSRHGKNGIGSDDYDRGARQQRVLVSLVAQTNVAALLPHLDQLITAAKGAVHTDIPTSALPKLLGLADKVDIKNIRSYVFAPPLYGTQGYFNGVFKLIPNVSRIQQAARNAFKVDAKAETIRRNLAEEAATVWVLNGSGISGQASQIAAYLDYEGMIASAPTQSVGRVGQTKIVAYNGAEQEMPDTAQFLKQVFGVAIDTATDKAARANFVITTAQSAPTLTPPPAP